MIMGKEFFMWCFLVASALALLSLGACGGSTPDSQPPLASNVTLSPADGTRTNGDPLQVTVKVTDATLAAASIWIDGAEVLSASAPSVQGNGQQYFNFSWHAEPSSPEGEHTLQARITLGGETKATPLQHFVLDRTAPQVTAVDPADHARTVCPGDLFTVHFDEAIAHWPDAGHGDSSASTRLVLADGGRLPLVPNLTADGGTMLLQTLSPGDGGYEGEASGELTLIVPAQLTDLAGNALQPFEAGWTIGSDCGSGP
jgi:hypothetical protein